MSISDMGGIARSWWWRKHQFKKYLRSLLYRKALRINYAVFDDPLLAPILAHSPSHGSRVLRSYLVRGLGAEERAHAVAYHFGAISSRITAASLHKIYLDSVILVSRSTPAGLLVLRLADSAFLRREGELRLSLELDGRVLHLLALTLVSPARIGIDGTESLAIWVGCSKGPYSHQESNVSESVKRATKAMQGVRPKALMLHAVQGLAEGWGTLGLYGVSNKGTVFASYLGLGKRIKADYDQFWEEYGGILVTPYAYRLPERPVAKDLSLVASNKRAAAARKSDTARQWFEDVRDAALAMRTGEP